MKGDRSTVNILGIGALKSRPEGEISDNVFMEGVVTMSPKDGNITCFVALSAITAATLWQKKLSGKYSSFTIAGSAIGVTAPKFRKWHKTFWDNLETVSYTHLTLPTSDLV